VDGAKKLIWIICQSIKFKRKIESKTNSIFGYYWQHQDSNLWFGMHLNPTKIYLSVIFFCLPERCGLIFLQRWWKMRLGRKRNNLELALVSIYKNNYSNYFCYKQPKNMILTDLPHKLSNNTKNWFIFLSFMCC